MLRLKKLYVYMDDDGIRHQMLKDVHDIISKTDIDGRPLIRYRRPWIKAIEQEYNSYLYGLHSNIPKCCCLQFTVLGVFDRHLSLNLHVGYVACIWCALMFKLGKEPNEVHKCTRECKEGKGWKHESANP